MGLTLNKDGMYCCAICQAPQATIRGLSTHVLKKHSMEARAYYDAYVKLESEGICKICGKPTKFHTIADGYRDCCSQKCANKYMFINPEKRAEVMAKREATCMERYGVTNGGGSKEALAKANATNLAKRGVLYPTQCKDVIEKSKETCLSKYGTTTYVHSAEGTERVTDTVMGKFNRPNFFSGKEGIEAARAGYMEKHGYDHNMHDPVFLEKWKKEQFEKYDGKYFVETDRFKDLSRETQFMKYDNWYSASAEGRARYQEVMLKKHGVSEYFQSDEFKQKSEATLMKEYNVPNYAQTPMWKEQVKATSLEKYGEDHYAKTDEFKQRYQDTCMRLYNAPNYALSDEFYKRIFYKYFDKLAAFHCTLVSMDARKYVKYKCDICGTESTEQPQFIKARTLANRTPCTHCLPKNPPVSIEEHEVTEYIESLGFHVTHYDRGFLGEYGADIVIEDKKLIVEYDGIFWHSELFKHSTYHLEKTMLAAEKGYRMVHIFSDEWVYRENIVKNRLAMLLGKYSGNEPIAARDCIVGAVSTSESEKFLDNNHLQGYVNAKWTYGLYHDKKLVALMSFGTNRYGKGVEMFRYCPLMGYRIQGGAGKLFSHFVQEHPDVETITSFADARWSTDGAFYTKLGFTLDAMSDPGYFLVDGDIRRNRMQFQRHKIAGPGDEGKSENDITLEHGLYRIYDCGQYRYVWKRGE